MEDTPTPQLMRPAHAPDREHPAQRLPPHELLLFTISFLITLLAVAGIGLALLSSRAMANRDFISYWATGHQFVHHANPYDAASVFGLQQHSGYTLKNHALFMRNPPFALVLTLPIGYMGLHAASILWSFALAASLAISLRLLWILLGRPAHRLYLAGLCFAPALACLGMGQAGIFCLLGLVLFLYLHRIRPLLAGIALWLCALKPHLFLPFAAALLLWIVWSRAYRVVAGFALAMAASLVIVFWIDPSAWLQYRQMMHASAIDREFIPTLSLLLRLAIAPGRLWLQSIPSIAACIWAFWYTFRHRHHWNWLIYGSVLMLVSVLVAPYAWLSDQVVLLPAILFGIHLAQRSSFVVLMALNAAVLGVMLCAVSVHSPFYLWVAPAWLAWYLFAAGAHTIHPTDQSPLTATTT
jgi:hypothetical protein